MKDDFFVENSKSQKFYLSCVFTERGSNKWQKQASIVASMHGVFWAYSQTDEDVLIIQL